MFMTEKISLISSFLLLKSLFGLGNGMIIRIQSAATADCMSLTISNTICRKKVISYYGSSLSIGVQKAICDCSSTIKMINFLGEMCNLKCIMLRIHRLNFSTLYSSSFIFMLTFALLDSRLGWMFFSVHELPSLCYEFPNPFSLRANLPSPCMQISSGTILTTSSSSMWSARSAIMSVAWTGSVRILHQNHQRPWNGNKYVDLAAC